VRAAFLGISIIAFVGLPLQAASTLTGSSLNYQPVSSSLADASLQDIRSRALSGNLTADDILKAAEQIRAVQQNTDSTSAPAVAVTPTPVAAVPPPVYRCADSNVQIPIDDSAYPLGSSARSQLYQQLNRLPARQLSLVKNITVAAPVSDPALGQQIVSTEGNSMTLYGTSNLNEAATEGVGAVVYDSLQGSPQGAEWQTHGDFSDFVQTYKAWVENTQGAFDEAKQSENSSEDLSQLFFIASLFTDESTNRITTYNPTPQDVAWQVQEDHYGFGPYTFDVYHNQIVHLAQNGVPLTASAADIPSVWTRQGLGN
jgi:hypothetical protein